MRKLIFIIIALFNISVSAQQNRPYAGKIVYSSVTLSAQLDLSKTSSGASPSGWNRINYDGSTTIALNTPSGTSTGWSFTFNQATSGDAGSNYEAGFPAMGDADFPDNVIRALWYFDVAPGSINISFSGLNPSKTYKVLGAAYGQGSQDGVTITLQGTTLSGSAFNNLYKPLFASLTPNGSGVISGTISRTSYYGVLSALIITEN